MRKLPQAARVISLAFLALACTGKNEKERPKIGFAQVSSVAALDDARNGFFRALADSGYVRDSTITILERNAQGDIPSLSLIMSEFLQQNVTQVATISSVATQAALKSITDRPIVFGAVANPYVIGAGVSPTKHRANVTGAEIPLPVDSAMVLAHEAFPAIKAWGTLFDPGDPFAEFYLEKAKAGAAAAGVTLDRQANISHAARQPSRDWDAQCGRDREPCRSGSNESRLWKAARETTYRWWAVTCEGSSVHGHIVCHPS